MKTANKKQAVNKPLLKRWIAALESGNFRQAKGRLKRVHGGQASHCCLGVLRELEPAVFVGKNRVEGMLPEDGLKKVMGCNIDQDRLANMNDRGDSFKVIARHLRRTFGIR